LYFSLLGLVSLMCLHRHTDVSCLQGSYDSDFLDDTALIKAFDNAIKPIKVFYIRSLFEFEFDCGWSIDHCIVHTACQSRLSSGGTQLKC